MERHYSGEEAVCHFARRHASQTGCFRSHRGRGRGIGAIPIPKAQSLAGDQCDKGNESNRGDGPRQHLVARTGSMF
jgi:hypothetical protein